MVLGILFAIVATIFTWGFVSKFMPNRPTAVGAMGVFVGLEALLLGWHKVALILFALVGLGWVASRLMTGFAALLVKRGLR